MIGYAVGSAILAFSQNRSRILAAVRITWTIACLSLVAHFICAFDFYHEWSHELAYRDTARQTAEVVGFNWGGGLFINYLVLIAWISDVGWWWFSGIDSYDRRRPLLVLGWHAFFIFIIFNATVVFKDGIVRFVGIAISLCLIVSWCFIGKQMLTKHYRKLAADQ
jgi:hypothetical protein